MLEKIQRELKCNAEEGRNVITIKNFFFNSYKHTPTILSIKFNPEYLFKRNEDTQRPVWRSFRSFILNCQNLEISQMSIVKRTGKKKWWYIHAMAVFERTIKQSRLSIT